MSLPKPFYEEPGITIYCADNRDILPHLPKVDLVLTDPPYGLASKLSGGTWGAKYSKDGLDWDQTAPDMKLTLEAGTNQIIWGGNYFQLPPSRCWYVWNKPERGLTMADAEIAWVSKDGNIRVFDSSRNPDGKREHETQKPEGLMKWCLNWFPEANTIIDPFFGSGTTLRAAKDLGRKAIGIEIS